MQQTGLKGSVKFLSLDFNPIDTNDILDVHKYLMNVQKRKSQLLKASPEILFRTPSKRILPCVDILWRSCSQLSATC